MHKTLSSSSSQFHSPRDESLNNLNHKAELSRADFLSIWAAGGIRLKHQIPPTTSISHSISRETNEALNFQILSDNRAMGWVEATRSLNYYVRWIGLKLMPQPHSYLFMRDEVLSEISSTSLFVETKARWKNGFYELLLYFGEIRSGFFPSLYDTTSVTIKPRIQWSDDTCSAFNHLMTPRASPCLTAFQRVWRQRSELDKSSQFTTRLFWSFENAPSGSCRAIYQVALSHNS